MIMKRHLVEKVRASLLHLAISATVVGAVLAVIFFLWYPAPFFQVVGAWAPVKVMIGVDLVLGPLMTLIVYRRNKPSLVFDLSVIALIQLGALAYGVHVVYQERPYFVVHALDRFEVLAARDVDMDAIADPAMRAKPWRGPVFVAAVMPEDLAESQRLLEEVLFEGKPDIERRPAYWHSYASSRDRVLASTLELELLQRHDPAVAPLIDAAVRRTGQARGSLRFLPIVGKKRDFCLLLDSTTGQPLGLLQVDPWPAVAAAKSYGREGASEQGGDQLR